ncbi:rac serine-threonine kinase-like protein [Trypanosoma rangeli]|uniref:Rac serine-threonine kinase-like protein n=1 Tax=Trypanosoma rangeli TaxID=5698 RepID=A0A422P4V9_TRYRA|nr:rac serine-threonine kinase-like protein [Trypanosoma rangeli]RNF12738.1 rac serine-threonine kinase-like protein [Trypanosoma rangeli]|eukprot:RNF12738.1 rac serine-threonine kinase-like protein [Trypanosoma rangeli]
MPAEHSGYLQKLGGRFYKKKQTRYFELRGSILYYWKRCPSTDESPPMGSIDLADTQLIDNAKDPRSWAIEGVNLPKTYTLIADSEDQKKEWMEKMSNVRVNNQEPLKPTIHSSDEDETVTLYGGRNREVSLDDFELDATIGAGSFSNVFVASEKSTGKVYAIKEMRKELIQQQKMVGNIAAERHILQTISHPFIVSLHYAFQTKKCLYLVLDFLPGGELFFHLAKEKVFDEYRAKFYCGEIALAIGYLHSLDIVFRDLKPENIVLDKDGHACLTDFGLAKMNVSSTNNLTFCGTSEYIAPEFLLGQPHGRAVDWWALGILLYEMIEGIPPFFNENSNDMYEEILKGDLKFGTDDDKESGLPVISEQAKDLLHRLLDRNPQTRLQDLEEFKKHPFFDDIDWEKLSQREIEPPFRPSSNIFCNFDEDFTSKEPRALCQEEDGGEQASIAGFSFDGKVGTT